MSRTNYPSDMSDDEWDFVMPYLSLMSLNAPQRSHDLREMFNSLRGLVRSGAPWRYLPGDFPRWEVVYQQTQRWINAHDLRALLRQTQGRNAQPSAAISDSRTLQSTPGKRPCAGCNGHKRQRGTKIYAVVDTLGHWLALCVTPANEGDRSQVEALCDAVQEVTEQNVQVAFVDAGYSGPEFEKEAGAYDMRLEVVKSPEATKSFVLLPKRWVM